MAARKAVAPRPARRVPFIHFDFGRKAPSSKPKAKELMPNLLYVFTGLAAVLMGMEWMDGQAVAAAQAALDRPNLTPDETEVLAQSLADARDADAANDNLINTALGALAATLIQLTRRNGDK